MTVSWGRTIAFVLAPGTPLCTISYGLQSARQECSRNCVFRVGVFDLIREGEGEVAGHSVKSAMERFAKTAYDYWENREEHAG